MNRNDDLRGIDSRILRQMADQLKADAKLLYEEGRNQEEAMHLFRLFRRITEELHRRANPAIAWQWN